VVSSPAAALVEAASEEAAAELATEEAVLAEEPPQAVRARAATDRPAAARKLRREIFFIFKHSSNVLYVFAVRQNDAIHRTSGERI
jgi:hypothetical protein